jgi:putative ATP-binding cassette transporter
VRLHCTEVEGGGRRRDRGLILDEATSALDVKNEEHLYRLLQAAAITYISVGHRPSVLQYHQHVLELTGEGRWRLLPVETYMLETSAMAL